MSIVRDRFRDGAGVLSEYVFEVGHREEQAKQQRQNLERTATTDGVGFVRQQGAASPQALIYSGTILTQNQHDRMQEYFDACRGHGTFARTVFFRDVDDTEYEVLITDFAPQRKGVVRNQRDVSILWIWEYQLEMEIIGVVV